MEVHFSQRLILGEWSWSLHRATEKDATVAVSKSEKTKIIIIIGKSTQPVSAPKMERTAKRRESLFCSGCFPSLKTETVRLAGLSAHSCLALELGLEVHRCTAAWFDGWREEKESWGKKGKRWRSSRTSPAGPGTCPGQQLQLLLWRNSQLSLATSDLPPPPGFLTGGPCLDPETSSQLSLLFDSLSCSWSENYQVFLSEEPVPLLLRSPSALRRLPPTKWRVAQAARGKYVSSPSFKISPPPW